MKTVGLCLEALDVLFFRDGRPFMDGTEQMLSGLPLPQTLAGAICTALMQAASCDFGRLRHALEEGKPFAEAVREACSAEAHWIGALAVRGPWLARWDKNPATPCEVLVPAPATLHRAKGKAGGQQLFALAPLQEELPGWHPVPEEQRRPLWLKEAVVTEPVEGYLTPAGLFHFLEGKPVSATEVVPAGDLFGLDYRIGIGISPERLVSEESQIYGRGFLALKQGVFLYAEVCLPDDAPAGALDTLTTLAFGGESRHVLCHRLKEPFAWPREVPSTEGQKPLVLLTTPCVFAHGWKPEAFTGRLAAAAVSGSVAFSGWDLARGGPKPTRFAVPAGSVYFLNDPLGQGPPSLAETDDDRRQGWGCYVTGVWEYV
ncbi:type III-B CRISPR module-associated protein Cmr3 [Chloracidobacterium sp. D]|uniref:type III-B CRISPR module-associated protein Cmr3 n=1 Tax=Chloracidobacterium sp. D TaxID=2821536 RepID=UPI001B8C346E|nr:type III-B CRISPR module-associated protein Cmr3 [Chloracidobacterium sp. D]QUV81808.1 type III-B CRISPR module-associated protein Cmr3 [Chloracidobacterium sp. D]